METNAYIDRIISLSAPCTSLEVELMETCLEHTLGFKFHRDSPCTSLEVELMETGLRRESRRTQSKKALHFFGSGTNGNKERQHEYVPDPDPCTSLEVELMETFGECLLVFFGLKQALHFFGSGTNGNNGTSLVRPIQCRPCTSLEVELMETSRFLGYRGVLPPPCTSLEVELMETYDLYYKMEEVVQALHFFGSGTNGN